MKLPKSQNAQMYLSMALVIVAIVLFYGLPPVMARTITDNLMVADDQVETVQSDASAPVISIPAGTVGILSKSSFVFIKNPDGAYAGTGNYKKRLDFNQRCLVDNDARVTAVAERSNKVLVRYYLYWHSGDVADVCESGTLFWISADEFRKLKSESYKGKTIEQVLEIEEIKKLIFPLKR